MKKFYTYDDILIVPQFSNIASRKDINLTQKVNFLSSGKLDFPIISANMDTITGSELANELSNYGGLAALHRFQSIDENVQMFLSCNNPDNILVSIGLGDEELARAQELYTAGAMNFIIDVAHGATLQVIQQVIALYYIFGENNDKDSIEMNPRVIVGNFGSQKSLSVFLSNLSEILSNLEKAGELSSNNLDITNFIQGIKLGIGSGSICSTRLVTGIGFPQFSLIQECKSLLALRGLDNKIDLIADGGIKHIGDIAKALGAGATAIMSGYLFAGTPESLGYDTCTYRGSASMEAYEETNKVSDWRASEGVSCTVSNKESIATILQQINGGLRSSLSYTGSNNLLEFRKNIEFIEITNSTIIENKTI